MAKTFQQLMEEAKKDVKELTVQEVQELLQNDGKHVLLDVREKDEYREGHLEGAVSLPRGFLEIKVESTVPDKSTPIVAYCAGGVRSLLAAKAMKEMGYQNVISMAGGYSAWKTVGYKWTQDRQFTQEQLTRYSRHFLLPEVGEEGQAKAARRQGPARRGRRAGFSLGLLPCGRRCRDVGNHRQRRGRSVESAAADFAYERPDRHAEDRIREANHPGAQPRCPRHHLSGEADVAKRDADHQGLRRDRRWLR
jgi:rhodanese-related sulfurtransferase